MSHWAFSHLLILTSSRFGGIYERGSHEYTLDDFYSLSLDKMDRYVCLRECGVSIPTGEGEDEESSDDDGSDDEDEDSSEDEEESDEDSQGGEEEEEEEEEEVLRQGTKARSKNKVKELPSDVAGVLSLFILRFSFC